MYDDDGRKLHICFRDLEALRSCYCLYLIPTIGIQSIYIIDNLPEHQGTEYRRLNVYQTRIGFAWLRWQFSFAIAEWRDDRTIEELIGKD